MEIKIQLDEGAKMPFKKRLTDAGYDLFATEDITIPGLKSAVIDTGVHIAIPDGYYGDIRSRSGLNINSSVLVGDGTIDSGYTGSIKVKLYNHAYLPYKVSKGDRICQLVFAKYKNYDFTEVETLEETDRGSNGFGSSGK